MQLWEDVDEYLCTRLIGRDAIMDRVLSASREAGLPEINVAPNQGKLLMLLAQAIGATRILEFGTLGGFSTIWLARALPASGRLVTLEVNPAFAEVARRNLQAAGVAERVQVRVGPAMDTLKAMEAEPFEPFDLVFIDADKVSTCAYYQWSVPRVRPGGIIIVDNVVREGELINLQSADPGAGAMRDFFEFVQKDPRVDASALQTVGSKGHDGFALLRVR